MPIFLSDICLIFIWHQSNYLIVNLCRFYSILFLDHICAKKGIACRIGVHSFMETV